MASAFITNALQVNFDSVLGIQDNEGMIQMFRALEATGLRGFLGCPSVLYEQELEQFFYTAFVQDGDVVCALSGMYVAISETRFSGVFNLPTDGLTDLSEVPNDLVLLARTLFSNTSVPVQFSCKKRLMKYEFRLLNDILAKSITVKAGSFDAVTHERFMMMTAIHFGIKVNWSNIISEVFMEMADRTTRRAKGFAAQICVLLKGDPVVTFGEGKTFPPFKIISTKTVNTYIAMKKTIDARGESDEPKVAKVAIVKKKSMSKKKSTSIADKDDDDVHMEVVAEKVVSKKRTAAVSEATVVKNKRKTSGKAVSKEKDLALISVAQDAIPIQVVAPISVVPAQRPHAQKRKAPKRNLRMTAGSDDEIVEKESVVETVVLETDVVELDFDKGTSIGTILADMEEGSEKYRDIDFEFVESATGKDIDSKPVAVVVQLPLDEESLSLDDLLKRIPWDMMLPSVLAVEPVKIIFSNGISIPGVADGDWLKENLPKIAIADKGKVPLVEPDTIKGHPASVLKSLNGIAANEEQVKTWGETDSVQSALQRRFYTVAKKVPLEDLIYTSCTDPIPQPAAARTPRLHQPSAVTHLFYAYVRKATNTEFNVVVLGRDLILLIIKQLRTQRNIGNLQNHLLSRIDDLEKASADARTQQDQDLRGHFKSVLQEIQIHKIALSFEVHEFKQGVRAESGIFSTDLADIRKEVRDLSKEFYDKLAATRNDLIEFRVATQEQYATLRDDLAGLIAFVTRGRGEKKGEVGSSHGRGQPPLGEGGSSDSRSEPSRKRGSSGSNRRDWRYLING
ncbi:hypothetical protein F511_07870 [Dorcoceras hygrometricum]|uniref:Dystroglycan-like n=1 Tax=Dorcoceras hygrometricum TaxID=472368 RepID=A0A2Z7CK11_9LAMI|nr:hypothetical protein F511_07870 [Dorcoceras hygrometricum]